MSALLYNQDTAVERPTDQQYKEQTDYLNQYNIVGRETDKQTQIVTFTRTTSGISTYTMSRKVILTGCYGNILQTTATSGDILITANGQTILSFECSTSPAGGNSQTYTTYVPLPNILMEVGQQIIINLSAGSFAGIVYAYYAD